jgi:4-azaleucine resistance transporter AzlC
MREGSMRLWWEGVRGAQPIMIGYLPVAVMFGISSRTAGLGASEALLISVLVFAGASQFALVGMIASGVPFPGALLATAGLNLRHLFYGPAIAPYLGVKSWRQALPLAFGLTDEVFAQAIAVLPARDVEERAALMLGLESGAYFSWLLGTLIGALGFQVAADLAPKLVPVLSFSLPSLFLVILLPLAKGRGAVPALVAALVAAGLILCGYATAALLAGGLAGATVGAFRGGCDER